MSPLAMKVARWIGLLLVAAIAIDVGARLLVSAIPFLATLLMLILIFGVLFGIFGARK
jgi:hypothetical protein